VTQGTTTDVEMYQAKGEVVAASLEKYDPGSGYIEGVDTSYIASLYNDHREVVAPDRRVQWSRPAAESG
jgi:hypothetical protein